MFLLKRDHFFKTARLQNAKLWEDEIFTDGQYINWTRSAYCFGQLCIQWENFKVLKLIVIFMLNFVLYFYYQTEILLRQFQLWQTSVFPIEKFSNPLIIGALIINIYALEIFCAIKNKPNSVIQLCLRLKREKYFLMK